ncbi:hypothetical protein AURDEDRAFT_159331 [Auricularia subglabra TFB-10046 SS5]|nr:hypothetical protein AURDEDRAFT_159331 [Auricularia subglabra TFB-10046 SS5]
MPGTCFTTPDMRAGTHSNERDNTASRERAPASVGMASSETGLSEADAEEPDRAITRAVFKVTNNFTGPISKIVINQA